MRNEAQRRSARGERVCEGEKAFHPKGENLDAYLAKYEKYRKMFSMWKGFLE
jgi:hypothetical protein